ncbi:secretion protein EccC [Mycolicibacterium elephantis]|uniref:type VII secretion protein EccCa n=1 Tax=Mycolicibacterium elephantis TaxID=81858 RepID=UPI000629B77A|nr:type VII secretion protein EccCa [Mycolicibacterium elephantis]KKW65659.1 secretion protein EccC [Mycolicibacterium elephantis]
MEFVRESRLPMPPTASGDLVVEAPPQVPKAAPVNPLARLMPLALLVAAVGMMVFYFRSGVGGRNPMFLFFPVMMLVSVLGTVAYGARGANRSADITRDRQSYLRYLDTLETAIAQVAADQHRSLWWRHPDPDTLWTLAGGPRMWERRAEDADFGHVRIGIGEQPLCTALVPSAPAATDEHDPVTVDAMRRMVSRRATVADVPVVVRLCEHRVVSVEGDAEATRALIRAMLCQLAVAHAPGDLAVAAAVGPDPRDEWDWLKWLPHYAHQPCASWSVVVVDGGAPTAYDNAGLDGEVTVIAVGAALGGNADGLRLHVDDLARPDSLSRSQAVVCARRLARHRPATASDRAPHSDPARNWLDLMGIDDPHRIDPERQWASTRGRRIKPIPIGVAEDGSPVYLDINEAAQNGMGPHGLCVGATGSGKSEFLRTLVLGMTAAHPPEALNFALVDFKGGATFLGMHRIRHVAAIITNLAEEAHLVSRMSDALAGEMHRRQEVLRAAGGFANVADYDRARAHGAPLPPLPALFVVVDEFSELLSQHPDFAELFVAIGRLGRSLGMHLLLASQRLDEGRLRGLETHLSYRICLKTFSAADSRIVLGVPDAYHLPSRPGAAYLKTTSGDLTRFQTAFVSGAADRAAADDDGKPLLPRVFTADPTPVAADAVAVAEKTQRQAQGRTVLDTVLDRLVGRGTAAHQVWLPPLVDPPTLDMLPGDIGGLRAPLGLVDRPFEQRHDVLTVDLSGAAGNVAIVGAPRSGKSTALRTMMLALAESHDPTEVGFYCLDFGGGALSSLRELPHVGAVAGRRDVALCRRTVAVMESVVRAREERFTRLGIDSVADYRTRRAAGDPAVREDLFGDVFLVVDGWATLRQEFDALEGPITAIAAQGLSYGVHVVVTASRWAELRPALKDQIATRIELRLGEPAESEMDRKRARLIGTAGPGRGVTADGREMLIALPRFDGRATVDGLGEAVAARVTRLRGRYGSRCAPAVELLPDRIGLSDAVARTGEPPTVPRLLLGIGERELQPVTLDFAAQPHLLVLGEVEAGKTSVLRLLCHQIIRGAGPEQAQIEIVDFRRSLLGVVESEHLAGYAASPAALTSRLQSLLARLEARMPGENVTQQQLRNGSWWAGPHLYVVVDDYDLVATSTGNPLTPLADFLPYAKDLGLHMIVARRSSGAARAMFDPVLARLREPGCSGLMLSADPEEGVLLGAVRPAPLPPGRGTLIARGGGHQLIQVAWVDPP